MGGKEKVKEQVVRLRITKHDDEHVLLEALTKIKHFGFGTFLCDLGSEEVECDAFSKQALLDAREQSGLNGMEIWEDNRVAWGDPQETIIMPISEISRPVNATWIEEIIPTLA